MKRTILVLSVLWVLAGTAPAVAAFLGENPRLGEILLNTGIGQAAGDVNRDRLPGSCGSCLERPAECFVAPAAGRYGIDLENLRPTGTVAGEAATRPYINSPLTIKNIIESGTPAADKFVPGALRWEVPGSFNGSQGVYELVIDPATNRILHFLFRSGG